MRRSRRRPSSERISNVASRKRTRTRMAGSPGRKFAIASGNGSGETYPSASNRDRRDRSIRLVRVERPRARGRVPASPRRLSRASTAAANHSRRTRRSSATRAHSSIPLLGVFRDPRGRRRRSCGLPRAAPPSTFRRVAGVGRRGGRRRFFGRPAPREQAAQARHDVERYPIARRAFVLARGRCAPRVRDATLSRTPQRDRRRRRASRSLHLEGKHP